MDNNLNDQITENSEGEEKSPSSYTDPNAGYTEAEPQAKNDNSVPKEAADDNLKQEEKTFADVLGHERTPAAHYVRRGFFRPAECPRRSALRSCYDYVLGLWG